MRQKVKQSSGQHFHNYDRATGYSRKQLEAMSASEIVWCIKWLANDKHDHPLWEDCARWLDCKMRTVRKLVSYLESREPKRKPSKD